MAMSAEHITNGHGVTGDQPPGAPYTTPFDVIDGSEEPFFNPNIPEELPAELSLLVIDGTITGSFTETPANLEVLKETLLTPDSKAQHQLTRAGDPVKTLLCFLELTGATPPAVNTDELTKKYQGHPAISSFVYHAQKQNRHHAKVAEMARKAFEYYREAYFNEANSVDVDALIELLDTSDQYAAQPGLLQLLVELNRQLNNPDPREPTNNPSLKEAERLLRILILNENDQLD